MIFSFHFGHSYAKRYDNDQKEKKKKKKKEEEEGEGFKFFENVMLKCIMTKESLNTFHLMYDNFYVLKNFDFST